MNLGYARGMNLTQQLDLLDDYPADELFSDGNQDSEAMNASTSEFQALMNFAQPGDVLVIASWEVVSRDYRQLLACLDQLEERNMELDVLHLPQLTIDEWRQLFLWSLRNERLLHPILMKVSKERTQSKDVYTLFSKDPEARTLYREILWLLVDKQPIRQVAKQKRVPLETVYRIQQGLRQVQLALTLVLCFLLAIFSIKLAEAYFDQLWIQVVICIIVTGVILWNVVIDTEIEDKPAKKKNSPN